MNPQKQIYEVNKLQKRLRRLAGQAIAEFDMIGAGDRVVSIECALVSAELRGITHVTKEFHLCDCQKAASRSCVASRPSTARAASPGRSWVAANTTTETRNRVSRPR